MSDSVKFVYGKRQDGCVERCRAKPENRGRGRCPHVGHMTLTDAQAQEMNQERLSESVPGFHVGAGESTNDGAGDGARVVAAWAASESPVLVGCRNLVLACSIIRVHPTR